MLSALVSGLVHATNLIILTDINGLYDSNPQTNPGAKRFDELSEVTDDLLQMAEGAGSNVGTGGMKSKLIAAQTALSLGVKVFIGSGLGSDKLLTILEGNGDGTYIGNEDMAMVTKNKQWISLHSKVSGKIFVDEGAERALVSNGSSLLPAGIYEIKGVFNKGDVVEVFGANGLLGRGEVLYSDEELKQAMGKRTSELIITSIEVIHRDKWVKA
jgi:glutamate 5-kinase